jgi:hypothetical protein
MMPRHGAHGAAIFYLNDDQRGMADGTIAETGSR